MTKSQFQWAGGTLTGITSETREQNTRVHTEIDGMIDELELECGAGVKQHIVNTYCQLLPGCWLCHDASGGVGGRSDRVTIGIHDREHTQ